MTENFAARGGNIIAKYLCKISLYYYSKCIIIHIIFTIQINKSVLKRYYFPIAE